MGTSQPAESARPSRQKRVGDALRQDTRNRLLQAAGEEFPVHGYAGTTVTRLAAAAGVSVQTLYLAWGSKRALLRGYMENALSGRARLAGGRRPAIRGLASPRTAHRAGGPRHRDRGTRRDRMEPLPGRISRRPRDRRRLERTPAAAPPALHPDTQRHSRQRASRRPHHEDRRRHRMDHREP